MATFSSDEDGVERCTKRIMIRLSREENDFCVKEVGANSQREEYGGGKAVDDFLREVLQTALRKKMAERSVNST